MKEKHNKLINKWFVIISILLIFIILIVVSCCYEKSISLYMNFKVIFPEPNKIETIYYDKKMGATTVEKWTYSPKKMAKFMKNKDVKKIDVDKVNQIFEILVENVSWFKNYIEIDKIFDKKLINESNYYAVKVDTKNGITEDVFSADFWYRPAYFILIADVENNEVYIFESF